MSGGTVPSVANVQLRLEVAQGQVEQAVRTLEGLDTTLRIDAATALIDQLTQLRDLAGALATIALHLELFARDESLRAGALRATAQQELFASEASEHPHDA